jgi:hypothetical protein
LKSVDRESRIARIKQYEYSSLITQITLILKQSLLATASPDDSPAFPALDCFATLAMTASPDDSPAFPPLDCFANARNDGLASFLAAGLLR